MNTISTRVDRAWPQRHIDTTANMRLYTITGTVGSIDWLVSRDEIIAKPIALVHASHRGDDMLASLRLVLATVSERFAEGIFLQTPLNSKSVEQAESELAQPENIARMIQFLAKLAAFSQGDH